VAVVRIVSVLVAGHRLKVLREAQKAAVEVTGDPASGAVGDALRGLGGVVALAQALQVSALAAVAHEQEGRVGDP